MSEAHPTPEPSSPRAALALALLPGIGHASYWALLARYGSAECAWQAQKHTGCAEALSLAGEALDRAARCGARFLAPGDAEYAPSLYELEHPPLYLFARGDLSLLARPGVAIVGTRAATPY
ncbi:MAG: DNA-processing protein DprA, partial [Gemmatimonadaceae bacterium]